MTGYHFLLRRPKEGEETLIVYVSDMGNTATTYTDTGTDLDTRYGYQVRAQRQGQERSRPELCIQLRPDQHLTPLREHR